MAFAKQDAPRMVGLWQSLKSTIVGVLMMSLKIPSLCISAILAAQVSLNRNCVVVMVFTVM